MIIWGAGTPRSFRPIWIAEELGLSYEHRPIGPRTGETRTDAYTKLNRKQKIPFFQDDHIGLSESVAICRYLLDVHGPGELYSPTDALSRAKQDEWVCYIYGEIDETSLYVMRRHGDLESIYGEAPEAVKSSKKYASKHLSVVARHMEKHQYVVGEAFGFADVMLVSCIDWAKFYDLELPDVLIEYQSRIALRPGYKRAYEVNYPKPDKKGA